MSKPNLKTVLAFLLLPVLYIFLINAAFFYSPFFLQQKYPGAIDESYYAHEFQGFNWLSLLTPITNFEYVALIPNQSQTNIKMIRAEVSRYGLFWWEVKNSYSYTLHSNMTADFIEKQTEQEKRDFYTKMLQSFDTKEDKEYFFNFTKEQAKEKQFFDQFR